MYRDFNIGTAKPTKNDQIKINYHVIDVADPWEGFSAVVFKRLANTAINNIAEQGKLPIMVGGTGLYIDSVLFDFSFMPAGEPKLRAQLSKLSLEELLQVINHRRLDLTGIDVHNKRRLVRLIESEGNLPLKKPLRKNTLIIGLKLPRSKLRQRIEKRTDLMFKKGLKYEVEELSQRYGWDSEPMKGIGYREFKNYFDEQQSLAETKRRIVSQPKI